MDRTGLPVPWGLCLCKPLIALLAIRSKSNIAIRNIPKRFHLNKGIELDNLFLDGICQLCYNKLKVSLHLGR